MENLLVIGAGGHAKVVVDAVKLADTFRVTGVIGLEDEVGGEVLGVPIVGTQSDLKRLRAGGCVAAVIAVGSVGDPTIRMKAADEAREAGFALPHIVHPSAVVSPQAALAEGAFVGAGAIVGPGASIGVCAIVNSGAIVDHDCRIGDFVHVSPGAALSGAVTVGDRTHIGTGGSIIQCVSVGSDVLVGAGSVVVDNIENGVVAFGNPARVVSGRD